MGNGKSKSSRAHEKLEEHNPRYFAKVQARNETSEDTSRWRFRKKRKDREFSAALLSNPSRDQGYHVGTMSPPEVSTRKRVPKSNKIKSASLDLSPIDTNFRIVDATCTSKPIMKLPSPRLVPSRSLEMTASSVSSNSSVTHAVRDYYTDMMEEASRESREDAARFEANSNFDALLPSGILWTEMTRGAKVTSVTLSNTQGSPLLLAIGTENGNVAIVELYADSNRSKKHGSIRDLTRQGKIRSLDFSPCGKWLAIGGDDCTVCLLRLQFRKDIDKLPALIGHLVAAEFERDDRIYAVRFHPRDESILAVGGFDGMVTIASIRKRKVTTDVEIVAEIMRSGLVLSLDWSSDGSQLAVVDSNKSCVIFNDSWQVTGEIQRKTSIRTVKWSPDGRFLALGCKDGTAFVIDMMSDEIVTEIARGQERIDTEDNDSALSWVSAGFQCPVNSLCWSLDGSFLAIGGADAACALYETKNFAQVHELRRLGPVNSIDWKETMLAIGGDDKSVALLKTGGRQDADASLVGDTSFDTTSSAGSSAIPTMTTLHRKNEWILKEDFCDVDTSFQSKNDTSLEETTAAYAITAVAFSRARSGASSIFLAIASSKCRVTVLRTKDWRIVAKLRFTHPIRALQFSRRSELLAMGGDDGVLRIVSVFDWRVIKEVKVISSINTLGFSYYDKSLTVGCADGMVTVLSEAREWNILGEIDGSHSAVLSLDWSKRNLAVGRADGSVSMHESDKVHSSFFVPQTECSRDNEPISAVAFTARGRYLAVGGFNSKISIYSSKGGWVLCHEVRVPCRILSLNWSSSGRYLAYCGDNHKNWFKIIDANSWLEVNELQLQDTITDERTSDIYFPSWSNDDKWLVFGGTTGVVAVVDTESWKASRLLRHNGKLQRNDRHEKAHDLPQQIDKDSLETEQEEEFHDSKRAGITTEHPALPDNWTEIPVISQFLITASDFLSTFQARDPPPCVRIYVICMMMLERHVSWTTKLDKKLGKKIMNLDDGEPLRTMLRVLDTSVLVMSLVLENESTVEQWFEESANFALTSKDVRRLNTWSASCLQIEPEAPSLDAKLLMTTDQLKATPL